MAKSKKNKKENIVNTEAHENAEAVGSAFMDLNTESDNELGSKVSSELSVETSLFLQEEAESEGFLPEPLLDLASDLETEFVVEGASELVSNLGLAADAETTAHDTDESDLVAADLEGSELEGFESAQIDDIEFVEETQAESIIESILFASDRPVSLASIREVFKGTNIRKAQITRILDSLAVEYAGGRRGISLEEITGGYQLRTKIDNMNFLKRTVKARPFKLSGPALETLSIVAYKQPVVKNEIDQIRGVESGHLLRALMEKGLCHFEGKAETLPGKPMQYGTTRRFLEIFGLRNIKELPTLSQIDELLPEGIGDEEIEKPTLSMVTDSMSEQVNDISYSQGEEDLGLIENELSSISTSSDFFEQEKIRQKQKKDADKAQDIKDALIMGEIVSNRDKNWLTKYEQSLLSPSSLSSSEELLATSSDLHVDEDDEDEVGDELPFYEEADSDPEPESFA